MSLISRPGIAAGTDIGSLTATSIGTLLTASASANTKGSYAQLVASTARDTHFLQISICSFNQTSSTPQSIDVAVGAAASEQIIFADLRLSTGEQAPSTIASYQLPYAIPSGTRIAARMQSKTGSDKCNINMILFGGYGGLDPYNRCDTYGFTSSTSLGTSLDPGGTANTKGTYSQITASTSRDHTGLMFAFDDLDTTAIAATQLLDIAIGAAASEQIIIPNFAMASSGATGGFNPWTSGGVFPCHIPSGTRIAARTQNTNNTSGSRKVGITVYGVS